MTLLRFSSIVLLGLLPCAAPAAARAAGCDAAVTQAEINACTRQDWTAADGALNDAYRSAVASARDYDGGSEGGRAEATLRAAQRAWVAYRDAACDAEAATWEGGSGQPMVFYGCLARLTSQRTDDLLAYAGQ